MGMPLFVDYYTAFDNEQATMSFAPLFSSTKSQLIQAESLPRDDFVEATPIPVYGISFLHILLSLILTAGGVYGWYTYLRVG